MPTRSLDFERPHAQTFWLLGAANGYIGDYGIPSHPHSRSYPLLEEGAQLRRSQRSPTTAKKPNENRQRSSLAKGQRREAETDKVVAWMRLSAKSAVWARSPRSSGAGRGIIPPSRRLSLTLIISSEGHCYFCPGIVPYIPCSKMS